MPPLQRPISDLRGGGNTGIAQQEYDEILQIFMPSREMREHLLNIVLSPRQIADLVLGAPVSLGKKVEYCRRLSAEAEPSFSTYARDIQTALDELALRPGEVLLLYEAWYDKNLADEKDSSAAPFLSADAALRYIRGVMAEEAWDEGTACWTRLEKWSSGENGMMQQRYIYYLIRDTFAFFEQLQPDSDNCGHWKTGDYRYSWYSRDLNLPIPFQSGDIVEVNCLPFAPTKHVLLLEVDDNCCGVQGLYRREDGQWDIGALKHGHCWGGYRPMLSPLYRISSCRCENLSRDKQILRKVRDYIAGDAEKGRELWREINDSECDRIIKELCGL